MLDLGPVDRITVGAEGEPGDRTFYLQARSGDNLVTVLVEKQQVQLLAATVVDILSKLGTDLTPPAAEMDLERPIVPELRAGRLAIGYEEDRDLIMLEAEELTDEEAALDEEEELGDGVRFWATKEQMLALARQGTAVAAAGRPTCQFCGNPIDPEGHLCVAMNGHGEIGEA